MNFIIRSASFKDSDLILDLIRQLAAYEGMEDQAVAVKEDIHNSLFIQKQAEVLIGEENGVPVAFALFYPVYSTFFGRTNLFLEDLFIREAWRGKGYGKQFFCHLANIAVERGCERLDWYVLDENTAGADFYEHVGAEKLNDRRVFRMSRNKLEELANILS